MTIALPVHELVDAYRSGLTLPEIADRFAVSVDTVARRLEQAGVPRRPTGRRPLAPPAPTGPVLCGCGRDYLTVASGERCPRLTRALG